MHAATQQVIGGQDEPPGAAPLLLASETANRGDHGLESEPQPESIGRPPTVGSRLA